MMGRRHLWFTIIKSVHSFFFSFPFTPSSNNSIILASFFFFFFFFARNSVLARIFCILKKINVFSLARVLFCTTHMLSNVIDEHISLTLCVCVRVCVCGFHSDKKLVTFNHPLRYVYIKHLHPAEWFPPLTRNRTPLDERMKN